MSIKRRDSKNRVLRTGESRKKDGRYMYKYTDNEGKIKNVSDTKKRLREIMRLRSIVIITRIGWQRTSFR